MDTAPPAMGGRATCARCGVAVTPGYVKCPKCGAALPATLARARPLTAGGGTAVASATGGGVPVVPIAIGVAAVLALIIFLAVRGDDDAKPAVPPAPVPTANDTAVAPAGGGGAAAVVAPVAPTPDPRAGRGEAIADLDRALRTAQLWSTITVEGTLVDLQSGACADPQMGPIVDGALPALRASGIETVRCRERHGEIVFTRDL